MVITHAREQVQREFHSKPALQQNRAVIEASALISLIRVISDLVQKIWGIATRRGARRRVEAELRDSAQLLERVLSVFRSHGIPRTLIPRFLPSLTIRQACSNELLSVAMSDELLREVSRRFRVSLSWLYGISSSSYEIDTTYKRPEKALRRFAELLTQETKRQESGQLDIVFVANGKVPESGDDKPASDLRCVVLLRQFESVEQLEFSVVAVLEDDLPWTHAPARLYLKQLVLLAMHLGLQVTGLVCSREAMCRLQEESNLAIDLISKVINRWHPDDYVVPAHLSFVSKDSIEAEEVRRSLAPVLEAARRDGTLSAKPQLYDGLL